METKTVLIMTVNRVSAISVKRKLLPVLCMGAVKVFVSLCYDCTIFYPMKNISRTSELPVRSCENRRFPLQSLYGFT